MSAWAAVLVARGGNAGGAPHIDGDVAPELSKRGDAPRLAQITRSMVLRGIWAPVSFVLLSLDAFADSNNENRWGTAHG